MNGDGWMDGWMDEMCDLIGIGDGTELVETHLIIPQHRVNYTLRSPLACI